MNKIKLNTGIISLIIGALALIIFIPAILYITYKEETPPPIEEYHIKLPRSNWTYLDNITIYPTGIRGFYIYADYFIEISTDTDTPADFDIVIDIQPTFIYLIFNTSLSSIEIENTSHAYYIFNDFNAYGIYDFMTIEYAILGSYGVFPFPEYNPIFTPF